MWLSLVERCVRDAEVAGSNPVIPTISTTKGASRKGCRSFLLEWKRSLNEIETGRSHNEAKAKQKTKVLYQSFCTKLRKHEL